jgi:hypothetical protein
MTQRNQAAQEPPLQFIEDEQAEPGDVLDALCDLLLDLVDQEQVGRRTPQGAERQAGRRAGA